MQCTGGPVHRPRFVPTNRTILPRLVFWLSIGIPGIYLLQAPTRTVFYSFCFLSDRLYCKNRPRFRTASSALLRSSVCFLLSIDFAIFLAFGKISSKCL